MIILQCSYKFKRDFSDKKHFFFSKKTLIFRKIFKMKKILLITTLFILSINPLFSQDKKTEDKSEISQDKKTQINQFCLYCGAVVKGMQFCGQCGKRVN